MSEVVRRKGRDARGGTGTRDSGAQTVRRDAQEDTGSTHTVVPRQTVEHSLEQRLGHGDPACAAGLRDRLRDAPAPAGLVDVAPCGLLELSDTHSGRVEDEQRQPVPRRQEPVDGEHVFGRGRVERGSSAPGFPHGLGLKRGDAEKCGVRLDPAGLRQSGRMRTIVS